MSDYKRLFKDSVSYHNKKILGFVVIVCHTSSETKREKYSLEIFKAMKEIIMRNKNNFWSLVNRMNISHHYEDEDIYQECYFVLHKVIRGFKVHKKYNFYFYYNKALARHFYRFYEKLKKERVSYHEDVVDKKQALKSQNDFSTFDIDLAELSRYERRIVRYIMAGKQNTDEFCQKNKVSKSKFNEHKKLVIAKLKEIYASDERREQSC
jgi:DNA-directed RNA polymerase specialized sigma24 family protein